MTDDLNAIEKVANGLQNQLRKGFLSILVLNALKISPNHGYKLAKEIKKRMNDTWSPPPSSVSRTLIQLKNKGLVKVSEISKTGKRERSKYSLTEAGEKTRRCR